MTCKIILWNTAELKVVYINGAKNNKFCPMSAAHGERLASDTPVVLFTSDVM